VRAILAIISDSGKLKPKSKNKKLKINKASYLCDMCKDTKIIKIEGKEVKCRCLVEREIKSWLHPTLKLLIRRATNLSINLKKHLWLKNATTVVFKRVPIKNYNSQILGYLIATYYWSYMKTTPYYILTGGDYTESYVNGDHVKYEKVPHIFLKLGVDNFNKTLETTIYTLIQKRDSLGLKTWVYVDPYVSDSEFENLYGSSLFKYLEDKDNYDYLVTQKGNKIQALKGREIAT
jgi:hypothetical protein